MSKPKKYFCSKCGREMKFVLINAEKYSVSNFDIIYFPYTKYNKHTGHRQYLRKYYCPQKKWYNFHSEYIVDNLIYVNEKNGKK